MVKVDLSRCIGCMVCQNICPDGFEVIDGKARVLNPEADCIRKAAESCPRGAILLDDSEPGGNVPVRGQGRGMGRGFGGGRGRGRGMGQGRRWM